MTGNRSEADQFLLEEIRQGSSAAIVVLLARRKCGAAHVVRVVFATIGCFLAITALRSACQSINWVHDGTADAGWTRLTRTRELMDQLRTEHLFFAGLLLLISVVVLAWPEPRERLDTRAAEAEAS